VKQEKCIIRLDNEWLIVFWGEMNGEIVGVITYVRLPHKDSAKAPPIILLPKPAESYTILGIFLPKK